MSLVVMFEGSLSVVDSCTDAFAKVILEFPEYAPMLTQLKKDAREIVMKCAEKAIKKLEARGIKSRGYVEDETRYRYACRGARGQTIATYATFDADFCLYTDAFQHGIGIKVDERGTITFNTVRHSGTYSDEQMAEVKKMRQAFSAAIITEFVQQALGMVCAQVSMEVIEHEGRRIVHLRGVKS